ncbi:DNA-3-methyladenine glycosylase I [Listeria costaricensis]|uniref:DNA-3-methyladenine glycosylase I n=1 Tax=Listeria costaricensis TaxID=2026604 RepID=UPI000C07E6B1|nr:DNA-3-methyladenine glycosylase I [Listeria costaricensis]
MEKRCSWAENDAVMKDYHDKEWCVPSHDDRYIFEMLNLEGAQAGLSWRTILLKRAGYQKAFHHFEVDRCAVLSEEELTDIRENGEVIRNRLKIQAVRKNAKAAQKVMAEFGSLDAYFWHFTKGERIVNHWTDSSEMPAQSPLSETISKDLKKRGFSFVGPVIIYSFLQAIGIIDDHEVSCPCHSASL